MAGGKVPYHLRVNKYVERQLFLDLLGLIDRVQRIRESVYVSLGGPYLEDHAAIHWRFGTLDLVSVEGDYTTYERQLFNRPMELISCIRCTTGDLIAGFDRFAEDFQDQRFVIWLDYASARQRQTQLRELQALVAQLLPGDIVKVTLNAELATLFPQDVDQEEEKQRLALDKLRRKLAEYFVTDPVDHKRMTPAGVASILVESIQKSVLDGLAGSQHLRAQPLAFFRYSDGEHQMLTVSLIILSEQQSSNFLETTGLLDWEWLCSNWNAEVHELSVPILSIQERLHVDRLLVKYANEEVHAKLTFSFDANRERSMQILNNYVKHYRRCPTFVQISR